MHGMADCLQTRFPSRHFDHLASTTLTLTAFTAADGGVRGAAKRQRQAVL